MTATEMDALKLNLAKSDVRKASKHGSLYIGQTSKGTLSLERTEMGMKLTVCGLEPTILAEGTKAEVARALAPLYVVEVA